MKEQNTDTSFTDVTKFGKDHWSLLAYVESCCVDSDHNTGNLDHRKMRTNPNTHPLLSANATVSWKDQYSTRLNGFFDFENRSDPKLAQEAGLMIIDHDDWDCLDDLEYAGFLEVQSLVNGFVQMTDLGCEVAGKLRRHKALGGMYADFDLKDDLVDKIRQGINQREQENSQEISTDNQDNQKKFKMTLG